MIYSLGCQFMFAVVLSSVFVGVSSSAPTNWRDLLITLPEKHALETLKPQIWSQLAEPFMRSDAYLIRWIRRARLDVSAAKQHLLQTINWREKNNITSLLNETFYDVELDYHIHIDYESQDKEGRPVTCINFGDWNIRAAVLQGNLRRVRRYMTYSTEKSVQMIFKAQKEGRHVTRNVLLLDIDGLNLVQHGCALCVPLLLQWAIERDTYYPGFTEEIILINAPSVTATLLRAVRAVISDEFGQEFKVFGDNRKVWMEYLDKRIDKDQRYPRYGGTKPMGFNNQ